MIKRDTDCGDGYTAVQAENGHVTIRQNGRLVGHIDRQDRLSENELIMLCRAFKEFTAYLGEETDADKQ